MLSHDKLPCILSRELTDFSLPKIGEEFGGRDHTTVIHAHEKIANLLQTDSQLQRQLKDIHEVKKLIFQRYFRRCCFSYNGLHTYHLGFRGIFSSNFTLCL